MKKIKITIIKTSVVDDYEKGEVGETSYFGVIHSYEVENLNQVLASLSSLSSNEPIIFEDRLIIQELQNENGLPASKNEIELWKKNELMLFSSTYDIYLEEIEVNSIENNILIKNFPNLEVA